MARRTLKAPAVLRAITAAVAVVVLTAGPASARSAVSTDAAVPASPASCQPADLGISVPSAIAGDPDEGMGKRAWNIVFRNTSKTTARCAAGRRSWSARLRERLLQRDERWLGEEAMRLRLEQLRDSER